jgi:5-methylcytosine-specific restriction enzyme A
MRMLRPAVRVVDTRTVKRPDKPLDPFYNTPGFIAFRAEVIGRAGRRCEAIERGVRCTKAWPTHRVYADHIVELRDGGSPFDPRNGQCLCASHHQSKTFLARQSRMGGALNC